jgi:hypothetical protein
MPYFRLFNIELEFATRVPWLRRELWYSRKSPAFLIKNDLRKSNKRPYLLTGQCHQDFLLQDFLPSWISFLSVSDKRIYFRHSWNKPEVKNLVTVHPQNVRFKIVRFQNVRFQNVWNVRFKKRQVYKTSGLQNVRFTKRQVLKTSGCKKTSIYTCCACGWWKSAGSVAAMFAGKVMAVFYSLF